MTALELAKQWADFMGVDAPFEVQYGSFDGLPEEAKATGDEFGATFGYPDGRFIVCISDKSPVERLEAVIVHELVHVHTFSQSGRDPRDAMEVATELAAQLVLKSKESADALESQHKELERLRAIEARALGRLRALNCVDNVSRGSSWMGAWYAVSDILGEGKAREAESG